MVFSVLNVTFGHQSTRIVHFLEKIGDRIQRDDLQTFDVFERLSELWIDFPELRLY
jgi:hypothetical protein